MHCLLRAFTGRGSLNETGLSTPSNMILFAFLTHTYGNPIVRFIKTAATSVLV